MGPMRAILVAVLLVASSSPIAARPAARDTAKGTSSCFVQEVHTPFPESMLGDPLPKGFAVAPYDPDVEGMGEVVTMILSCTQGKRTISEEWVWTATIPPRSLRSDGVRAYGWLVASLASDQKALREKERRCMIPMFQSTADFAHDRRPNPGAGGGATRSTVTPHTEEGSYFDEVLTAVQSDSSTPAKRMRLFGPSSKGFASFDVSFARGRAMSGSGVALQRAGAPSASGTTAMVPGAFPGKGFEIDDVAISISSAGPSACGK